MATRDELRILITAIIDNGFMETAKTRTWIGTKIVKAEGLQHVDHEICARPFGGRQHFDIARRFGLRSRRHRWDTEWWSRCDWRSRRGIRVGSKRCGTYRSAFKEVPPIDRRPLASRRHYLNLSHPTHSNHSANRQRLRNYCLLYNRYLVVGFEYFEETTK